VMTDILKVPHALDASASTCLAIVESPKGRRSKFNYDPVTKLFRLHRLLPEGMHFPFDFGFIPSTRAEDGDPMDVMILVDEPSPVGALLPVRLVGVIEAEQQEGKKTIRNDRLLAVTIASHLHAHTRTISDLDEVLVRNICEFWVQKDALEGKAFTILANLGPAEAVKRIEEATLKRNGRRRVRLSA
jgi:inorganic pyrophosphatase